MTYPKIPMYKCQLVRDGGVTRPLKADGSKAAAKIAKRFLEDSPDEQVLVFFLDSAMQVIGVQVVAHGSPTGAAFTAAQVFRGAILHNAPAIIIAHNHPSGETALSSQDVDTYRMLEAAARTIGIVVFDFIVVAHGTDKYGSIND